jgi:hypothetical protein
MVYYSHMVIFPEFPNGHEHHRKWVRDWILDSPRMETGRVNPRFHTVIPIWKRGARTSQSPYGNGD